MNKDYTIGIYIRLSMADEDTGSGNKAESDSIGNQRMLINRYLDNHPTLSKYPRLEFADDGYTGTNFHRPQFAAMMEKVRHGEINLICVKDFSRFSRDYIETGNYLECTFPFMGVRFISINDGYDSDDAFALSPSTTAMTATITREQPVALRLSCAASSMPHTARIFLSKRQRQKSR